MLCPSRSPASDPSSWCPGSGILCWRGSKTEASSGRPGCLATLTSTTQLGPPPFLPRVPVPRFPMGELGTSNFNNKEGLSKEEEGLPRAERFISSSWGGLDSPVGGVRLMSGCGEGPRTEQPLSRQFPGDGPPPTPQVLLPSFSMVQSCPATQVKERETPAKHGCCHRHLKRPARQLP